MMDDWRELCPTGCGWLTDDPYGGPCSDCWPEVHHIPPSPRLWAADRDADPCDGFLEVRGSWRPVTVVDPGRFL